MKRHAAFLQLLMLTAPWALVLSEEPDCSPVNIEEGCPDRCLIDGDCDPDHACQLSQCGGCDCFLRNTEPPKDCCYDITSGCLTECEFHDECRENELCKPQPGCSGGCMCDAGQDCIVTDSSCPSDCTMDEGCLEEGETCEPTSCGGCRCALVIERDCCPDYERDPETCPDACYFDYECGSAPRDMCIRKDCGGCQCHRFPLPCWEECFGSLPELCSVDCQLDADCPGSKICASPKYCPVGRQCTCPDEVWPSPNDDEVRLITIADITSEECGGAHSSLPFFNTDCEVFLLSTNGFILCGTSTPGTLCFDDSDGVPAPKFAFLAADLDPRDVTGSIVWRAETDPNLLCSYECAVCALYEATGQVCTFTATWAFTVDYNDVRYCCSLSKPINSFSCAFVTDGTVTFSVCTYHEVGSESDCSNEMFGWDDGAGHFYKPIVTDLSFFAVDSNVGMTGVWVYAMFAGGPEILPV